MIRDKLKVRNVSQRQMQKCVKIRDSQMHSSLRTNEEEKPRNVMNFLKKINFIFMQFHANQNQSELMKFMQINIRHEAAKFRTCR